MNDHLTDDEIQQFVLNKNFGNTYTQQHIVTCKTCKAAAANYATLFKAIEEVPKPILEFDVVNLVMPALPKPKHSTIRGDYVMQVVLMTAIGVLCIPVYMYKKDLIRVFENMASVLIALIVLPVIAILLLQLYAAYEVYKKQMAAIK
jgi:hypothetical protein